MKHDVYYVANTCQSVTTSALKNGWHKFWPSLKIASYSNKDTENYVGGLRVSKEKQLIKELVANVNNFAAKELSSRIGEDVLMEWMNIDDNVPTVHHCTASEIIDLDKVPERIACTSNDEDESCDENEEDVKEKVLLKRLITLTTELLVGLEK